MLENGRIVLTGGSILTLHELNRQNCMECVATPGNPTHLRCPLVALTQVMEKYLNLLFSDTTAETEYEELSTRFRRFLNANQGEVDIEELNTINSPMTCVTITCLGPESSKGLEFGTLGDDN